MDTCLNVVRDALSCCDDAVYRRLFSTHSVDSTQDAEGVPSCNMKGIDQAMKVILALHLSLRLLSVS